MQPKKFNFTNFSERLEFAIEQSGKSKHAIAQAAGLSHTSIARYLKGEVPKQASGKGLAAALNVSVQWLLTGEGNAFEQSSTSAPRVADRHVTYAPSKTERLHLESNDDYQALVETFIGDAPERSLLRIISEMGERMVGGDRAAADQARVLIDMIHLHRPEVFTPHTELPYYGAVAAGKPSDIDFFTDETRTVPGNFRSRPHYLVRVRGKSMEPDYPDNSYVVVRALEAGEYARKGDIVIAHDGDGVCIKKLEYRVSGPKTDTPRKPTPHLVSINPDYDEIIPIADTPIQGIVVDQYDADFF